MTASEDIGTVIACKTPDGMLIAINGEACPAPTMAASAATHLPGRKPAPPNSDIPPSLSLEVGRPSTPADGWWALCQPKTGPALRSVGNCPDGQGLLGKVKDVSGTLPDGARLVCVDAQRGIPYAAIGKTCPAGEARVEWQPDPHQGAAEMALKDQDPQPGLMCRSAQTNLPYFVPGKVCPPGDAIPDASLMIQPVAPRPVADQSGPPSSAGVLLLLIAVVAIIWLAKRSGRDGEQATAKPYSSPGQNVGIPPSFAAMVTESGVDVGRVRLLVEEQWRALLTVNPSNTAAVQAGVDRMQANALAIIETVPAEQRDAFAAAMVIERQKLIDERVRDPAGQARRLGVVLPSAGYQGPSLAGTAARAAVRAGVTIALWEMFTGGR